MRLGHSVIVTCLLRPCPWGVPLGLTLVVVRAGLGGADAGAEILRDRMPSLAKMFPRWYSTVLTLTYSSPAAWRLVRPIATRRAIRLLGRGKAGHGEHG